MLALPRISENNRLFLQLFAVFLFGSVLFISCFTKTECFIKLNPSHSGILNTFFVYLTFLGNGIFALILFAVFLFFRQWLLAVQHLTAFITSGLLVQLFKQTIQAPRPKAFIDPTTYSGFIDGITHSGFTSFPSGHTATAFAMATVFSCHARNYRLAVIFLCMAISIGYSRIYLGQHFAEDVIAGSIVGVVCGLVVFHKVKSVNVPGVLRREPAMSQNNN